MSATKPEIDKACDCTWSCMTCEACPNCEGCEHCPKPAAVDVERELYLALKAVLVMWKAKPPEKLDEALTWRANDEKAKAMADEVITLYEQKGKL